MVVCGFSRMVNAFVKKIFEGYVSFTLTFMDRRDFRAGGLTESSLSILWGLEVTRAYSECCILSFTFEIHEGSMRVMVKDGRDKTATLNILNGYSNRWNRIADLRQRRVIIRVEQENIYLRF
ncbi:uncharacterized protein LOC110883767 isoform X2 [Helianthus annuus]|uniref:uncharacterized protein LOC110883767 isoform X2 n=1 Tax=Helianthus annuus TaxID=4232 RepID=UPI001653137D|nr:uncharacterized protein LOC110883767 isoform X2 [Helianthus annuus]